MMQQVLTISRNTYIESIRQPIFVVLILVAALAIVLNPSLAAYTLDDDNKLLIDLGLSSLFLAGLFLAAFTATGVLSREIENRTVLTVVSKPVARPLFVLGKYVGVAAAILLAMWTLSLVFLLTKRHGVMQTASDPFDQPVLVFGLMAALIALLVAAIGNYFYHWVFTSTLVLSLAALETFAWILVLLLNKQWTIQSPLTDLDGQLIIALVLVFQAVLVITAIAVAASTRLGQVMTLLICWVVFTLGLVSESILGEWASQYWIAHLFVSLTPNLQFLWHADALTQDHLIPLSHVAWVSGYSALYIAGVLSLAIALFQTREVG